METIKIHGKDYVPVNERIKYFRSQDCYEGWSIETNFIEVDDKKSITKTIICDEVGKVMATGLAYEIANSSHINKTSYIENCETSSIGRALGILGIGIDTSIASAEEVDNAIKGQESEKEKGNVTDKTIEMESCKDLDEVKKVYKSLGNFDWNDTEVDQLKKAVNMITEKFNGEVVR